MTQHSTQDDKIMMEIQELRDSDADLREEAIERNVAMSPTSTATLLPDNTVQKSHESAPYTFVPLKMSGRGGTHVHSKGSRDLIEQEVSFGELLSMTEKFYELAFQDYTLDKFIRSHNDPHGSRFAKWIHQKLTGSNVWDLDRESRDKTPVEVAGGRTVVVHDRTSAHVAAWHSSKRPKQAVGRHFTLEECRVWMRLHFWAMRESGLVERSPSFADYYVRFIGHFIAVYERSATMFARESFRWSADPKSVEAYIANGHKMKDVLGRNFSKAIVDLPNEEYEDDAWPYGR